LIWLLVVCVVLSVGLFVGGCVLVADIRTVQKLLWRVLAEQDAIARNLNMRDQSVAVARPPAPTPTRVTNATITTRPDSTE
jgi:hypothetical protein